LSSAVTLIKPDASADAILITVYTQNVRITLDGTVPTSTTGFQLVANQMYQIDVGPNSTVKVIQETASASIQYQWFHTRRDYEA
jgi:hypothetical protein